MRNKVLVIVSGGVADTLVVGAVEVYVMDLDNIKAGDEPPALPSDLAEAAKAAGYEKGKDFQ